MSMEESFIRGCYYYAVKNPVWYIYRARMHNYLIGLSMRRVAFHNGMLVDAAENIKVREPIQSRA